MEQANAEKETLKGLISETEQKLVDLKNKLAEIETRDKSNSSKWDESNDLDGLKDSKWPLAPEEYLRYGRQMIVPSIGIQGQQFRITPKNITTYQ